MKSSSTLEKDYDFEGFCKIVKGPDADGYLYKYFKKHIKVPSLTEQKRLLELKKQYFWKYIPETELCETEDGNYYIKQKYIKGNLIKNLNIHELHVETLSSLLDLFHLYILYCKEENQQLDIFWSQRYPDKTNIWGKRFKNFLKIYKNFLVSSNIIIDWDWKVFMIDICDEKKVGTPLKLQKIKNFCAKPFISYTFKKIAKLRDKKSQELANTLEKGKISCK